MPGAVIYISEFQNKLAWKFDISVSQRLTGVRQKGGLPGTPTRISGRQACKTFGNFQSFRMLLDVTAVDRREDVHAKKAMGFSLLYDRLVARKTNRAAIRKMLDRIARVEVEHGGGGGGDGASHRGLQAGRATHAEKHRRHH